jgi:ABC-type cobalt transport system substrate-binding protein
VRKQHSSGKRLQCRAFLLAIAIATCIVSSVVASEKWQGVDESVVQKVAQEHGREALKPFINTDQGDLLLFAFLLAGTIGGFAAGYYWRMLLVEKAPKIEKRNNE